jgi:hypothetical protein
LVKDDCGREDFDDRAEALASSVWQASDGVGAAKYLNLGEPKTEAQAGCGLDFATYVEIEPYPGGYTGRVLFVGTERCTEMACAVEYRVGP